MVWPYFPLISIAHALLQTFSRTILSLSKNHRLSILLLNNIISAPLFHHSNFGPNNPATNTPPSIFASNSHLRPALGKLFSDIPSLHLLLSRLPKNRADAKILYGSDADDGSARRMAVDYVSVVEVLKDADGRLTRHGRWESREQRWAAFVLENEGLGIKDAFASH
jgi:hypothetical protein